MSEVNLIQQARQGSEAAWLELVEQHQQAVFRLAYLLMADADDAKDVAQETFIRAFQALDKFDANRSLRPWLLRIAANLAHNRQRMVGRYLAALRRWFQAEPGQEQSTPDQIHHRQQEAHLLWQAVRRLRQTDQEIVYLRYFLELSVAETVEACGIAPGTVKSRLHRALGRLRIIINKEFPALAEEWIQ